MRRTLCARFDRRPVPVLDAGDFAFTIYQCPRAIPMFRLPLFGSLPSGWSVAKRWPPELAEALAEDLVDHPDERGRWVK